MKSAQVLDTGKTFSPGRRPSSRVLSPVDAQAEDVGRRSNQQSDLPRGLQFHPDWPIRRIEIRPDTNTGYRATGVARLTPPPR